MPRTQNVRCVRVLVRAYEALVQSFQGFVTVEVVSQASSGDKFVLIGSDRHLKLVSGHG